MTDKARFSQTHGIVPVTVALAANYDAGGTWESINMSKYNHCTLIITGNASVAGNGVLTLYGGATDAATTAAITFTYRYGAAACMSTNSDTLSTPATSAALTITGASLASANLVIEFDTESLNVSGTQYTFATPVLDASGTAGVVSAVAILSEPRFDLNVMPSAVS